MQPLQLSSFHPVRRLSSMKTILSHLLILMVLFMTTSNRLEASGPSYKIEFPCSYCGTEYTIYGPPVGAFASAEDEQRAREESQKAEKRRLAQVKKPYFGKRDDLAHPANLVHPISLCTTCLKPHVLPKKGLKRLLKKPYIAVTDEELAIFKRHSFNFNRDAPAGYKNFLWLRTVNSKANKRLDHQWIRELLLDYTAQKPGTMAKELVEIYKRDSLIHLRKISNDVESSAEQRLASLYMQSRVHAVTGDMNASKMSLDTILNDPDLNQSASERIRTAYATWAKEDLQNLSKEQFIDDYSDLDESPPTDDIMKKVSNLKIKK